MSFRKVTPNVVKIFILLEQLTNYCNELALQPSFFPALWQEFPG